MRVENLKDLKTEMSRNNERHVAAVEVDQGGTLLFRTAAHVVKRNPIKVSLYFVGLLICFFFSGLQVSDENIRKYESLVMEIDEKSLFNAEDVMHKSYHDYSRRRGWFWSCDTDCKNYKSKYEKSKTEYEKMRLNSERQLANAKSNLGIFSVYGVNEVRELFWRRFNAGKRFATNQSKWDLLFIGFRAMGRDESFVEYIIQIVINMLMNFTVGIAGAVISFVYYLWGVISTFQPGPLVGGAFFLLASISAISFAMSWLVCLYFAVAGTTFVAAKLVASNVRLENGATGARRQLHRD